MNQSTKESKSFVFFYILVGYIFLSLFWWTYLLIDKNETAYDAQMERELIYYNYERDLPMHDTSYFDTDEYKQKEAKYNRQRYMVIGEGLIIIVLLIVGVVKVWNTFSKEMALVRQQDNFLHSITHELKSPLAAIKLSLQTIFKRAPLEPMFKKLVNNSLSDVDRLETLVDNILMAAKIENSSYSYRIEECNLSELVFGLAQKIEADQEEYPREFSLKIKPNINAWVDRVSFSSVVINLMENAIKYSDEGAKIELRLDKNQQEAILEVADEGHGIPNYEKKAVFEKFYRVGNENTRKTKGTGIGLFIVQKVVEEHSGKITLQNNQPKGSVFRITIPLVKTTEKRAMSGKAATL